MSDNTREAFEAWAKSKGIRTERDAFGRYIDGQQHWAGWQAAWTASRLQAIEEAAKVADGFVDATEERRAHVASNMQDGTIGDQLSRLKHHQTVSMWNTALRRTAVAIRNLTHSEDGKA